MLKGNEKILLAGGGSAGPVTPLLAIVSKLQKKYPDIRFHWAGTKTGPERKLVAKHHISFDAVAVAKLHRFFHIGNLFMPFKFFFALLQSFQIVKRQKPDYILAAGGFTAVPIIWVGKLLGIPSHIHQLDIQPGLANKLSIPFVTNITVTFESALEHFPKNKTHWTGSPVRDSIENVTTNAIKLDSSKPTIVVTGGGTGAAGLNKLIWGGIEVFLEKANVIHLTGKGKGTKSPKLKGYHAYDFVGEEMAEILNKADIVIARAGLGTFMELARLKKPAILVPLPNSHQEVNADMFAKSGAVLALNQLKMSPMIFAEQVLKLLKNEEKRKKLAENIASFYKPDATDRMIEVIEKTLSPEESL